jgi:NAD+ synthase
MTEPAAQFAIALAQLNPTVGDVTGNAARARAARVQARAEGADLVVLSELFIAGYPPEDLILKPAFQAACRRRRSRGPDRDALGRGRQAL